MNKNTHNRNRNILYYLKSKDEKNKGVTTVFYLCNNEN